jgi:predicted nucleic acid-binding protein
VGLPGRLLGLVRDALILAAAQAMGCGVVLSEDLPAGQEMEGIRIVNPFAVRPGLAEP